MGIEEGAFVRTGAMGSKFNELPWHDAQLLEIAVDRRQAGTSDRVLLRVEWPDGQSAEVRFHQCYGMNAQMNFGVIAEDTILLAAKVDDDPILLELRDKWAKIGVAIAVSCYRIETNSSASVIRIYAASFSVS